MDRFIVLCSIITLTILSRRVVNILDLRDISTADISVIVIFQITDVVHCGVCTESLLVYETHENNRQLLLLLLGRR